MRACRHAINFCRLQTVLQSLHRRDCTTQKLAHSMRTAQSNYTSAFLIVSAFLFRFTAPIMAARSCQRSACDERTASRSLALTFCSLRSNSVEQTVGVFTVLLNPQNCCC